MYAIPREPARTDGAGFCPDPVSLRLKTTEESRACQGGFPSVRVIKIRRAQNFCSAGRPCPLPCGDSEPRGRTLPRQSIHAVFISAFLLSPKPPEKPAAVFLRIPCVFPAQPIAIYSSSCKLKKEAKTELPDFSGTAGYRFRKGEMEYGVKAFKSRRQSRRRFGCGARERFPAGQANRFRRLRPHGEVRICQTIGDRQAGPVRQPRGSLLAEQYF